MKKILLTTWLSIALLVPAGWAANTPFKIKITEEQHRLTEPKLTDILKLNRSPETAQEAPIPEGTEGRIENPRNDPFMPQIPKEPEVQPTQPGITPRPMVQPPTPPKPAVQKPNLTISGIIWNTDRPQAIINNQVVDVGANVNNITVVAINKTGVDILYSGEEFHYPYN